MSVRLVKAFPGLAVPEGSLHDSETQLQSICMLTYATLQLGQDMSMRALSLCMQHTDVACTASCML